MKIGANDLPTITRGDPDKLKVGEWVVAIGSPVGFEQSVTAGIVSAKGRTLAQENYVPFIQTDVAINPGNSGGPLFNIKGEVVGINSQIYSRTGGFMGLSFAIPIDVAMNVSDQLKTTGQVIRGWLGVRVQDVTRELAESFEMKKPYGALISQVLADSPAEKAGLKVGDVIVGFNDQLVDSSASLPPMVGAANIAQKARVKAIRNKRSKTIKVKLENLPGNPLAANEVEKKPSVDAVLGMSLTNLTAEMRDKWQIKNHGVLVKKVNEGAAFDAGIRAGDLIMQLNGQAVENVRHMKKLVNKVPKGKFVSILINRQGDPIFLALKK